MKSARAAKKPIRQQPRQDSVATPRLRFTPTAWAKLVYLRDCGDTEIGGFGISAAGDPLLVIDLRLISQRCTPLSVQFDDQAVADFFDEQVDLGRNPDSFARIWMHTHPGESPNPSGQDETTFARCFGRADWAVMFILAEKGDCYARLRFNAGPGGSLVIPAEVDYSYPFAAADHEAWCEEYCRCVVDAEGYGGALLDQQWETVESTLAPDEFFDAWSDYVDDDALSTQDERRLATDDLCI